MKEDIVNFPPAEAGNPFIVQLAGISWCDGTYRISRPACSMYVLEYVIKGRGYLDNGSEVFYPEAGDVYLVHENTSHEYGSSADKPWEKIWFNVEGTLMREMINSYGLTGIWHVPQCDLKEQFKTGLDELRQQPDNVHDCAARIVLGVIQALSRHQRATGTNSPKVSPEGRKLKNFLDHGVMQNPSTSDMAAHISRSVSQTIRIFKRDWGITPYQYLLDKRIQLAQLLLTNSVKSVKEVAYELGFVDEFYFSDIFKKKTGASPSIFRKQK